MNNETWQQLLSLESRDLTQQWFNSIHGHELNARRSKEINSAAKQAREYFRNAANANYAVKPSFLTAKNAASTGQFFRCCAATKLPVNLALCTLRKSEIYG